MENFLQKLNADSVVRKLNLTSIQGDMSLAYEVVAEALSES